MKHDQILEKLAAKQMVKSMEEDLKRLTNFAIILKKNEISFLLPQLLKRWNCVLNASGSISENYKNKTYICLAVLLHKYGFSDTGITGKAIKAIDKLNLSVALSDHFYNNSELIKELIKNSPAPLKRKPSLPENITFFRENDVISIQLEGSYYAAYIHKLTAPNETPVIELYDCIFNKVPVIEELTGLKAKGSVYNDGTEKVSCYAVTGMKYTPDPANQIFLVASGIKNKPLNEHLEKASGLWTNTDLFRIQNIIVNMFKD